MNHILLVIWIGLTGPATPDPEGMRLIGYGCDGATLFAIEEDEFPRCDRIEAYPRKDLV